MIDEGYVKFKCHHEITVWNSPLLPLTQELETKLKALDELRTELHDANFIGIYENGIGYGNISLRSNIITNKNSNTAEVIADAPSNFVISATATGGARELELDGYCLVTKIDMENNMVWSTGSLPASSETITHAAIYQSSQEVNCVVHIHNRKLYDELLKQQNSLQTPKNIAYGTVEMAYSIMEIAKKYPLEACIAMAGHNEGIIIYGISIEHVKSQLAFINNQLVHASCNQCKTKI